MQKPSFWEDLVAFSSMTACLKTVMPTKEGPSLTEPRVLLCLTTPLFSPALQPVLVEVCGCPCPRLFVMAPSSPTTLLQGRWGLVMAFVGAVAVLGVAGLVRYQIDSQPKRGEKFVVLDEEMEHRR